MFWRRKNYVDLVKYLDDQFNVLHMRIDRLASCNNDEKNFLTTHELLCRIIEAQKNEREHNWASYTSLKSELVKKDDGCICKKLRVQQSKRLPVVYGQNLIAKKRGRKPDWQKIQPVPLTSATGQLKRRGRPPKIK